MKKANKKDEQIDLSTLPKINIITSSLILDFVNSERRFKLLENIYKNPNKLIRLICRENIIEFAKERGIYVEPVINKKDPNPPEPKEITSEELAKSVSELIIDKSIPVMKDKKALIDKIEELKKQKEEAIIALNNPQPVDPKKKVDKKAPVNPDDIIIPVIDENQTDLIIILYNFPLNHSEYLELEKHKIVLNHVMALKEIDPIIEEPKEDDKNKKAKDAKPSNDIILMQKLFSEPSIKPERLIKELINTKNNSDSSSILRLTYFENMDFSYKNFEDLKKDSITIFQEEYANKLDMLSKLVLYYLKWITKIAIQKYSNDKIGINSENILNTISKESFEFIDMERISNSAILLSFTNNIIKRYRERNEIKENNEIIFEKNDIDLLFEQFEKQIDYELLNTQQSNSHLIQSINKDEDKINELMINADESSSCFKLIINHNDFILKGSLENKINNLMLYEKEKILFYFRNFPGIFRHMMPIIPPKEENFRKAKKCEVYPFLGNININIYEKFDILSKFENIFLNKLDRYIDFSNRIYQEPMNVDILSQVINNAMSLDTEVLIHYNERDDNMLLATYYRCPKGRIYRKTNKYRYLSKPDFENWVKFFKPNIEPKSSDHSKIEKNTPKSVHNITPNNDVSRVEKSIISAPYENDQVFYEIDDNYVGQVLEKVKYMFPSDNGVFINKVIENGIFSSNASYVVKDNLVFGIRLDKNSNPELWINFNNDMQITVNYIGHYDPFKCNYDCVNGTYTSITYRSGLFIQIMPNGEVCQKNYRLITNQEENYRIVTSKASVIKYNSNDKTNIMYANGNICQILNGIAINTNNKGFRVAKNLNDNTDYEMDPIPVTIQSDPESNTKILIREDKTLNIKYHDKSELTVHEDETKIYTYPDKQTFLIEHDDFVTNEIVYDPIKKRTKTIISEGSADALLGSDNIMTRSHDGRVIKTYLPDGTLLLSYNEKKATDELDKFTLNTITLIYFLDGTVIKIQQDGDIVLITGNERRLLNIRGNNLEDGKDVDYLFELNGKPSERKGGIYTADLIKKKIWTKDDEKNIFEIHADGLSKYKLSLSLSNLEDGHKDIDDIRPSSPKYDGSFYFEPDVEHLEHPSNFFPPRLFVIENNNTGYELLSEEMISNFKIISSKNKFSNYYIEEIQNNFKSHNWIIKYFSVNQRISQFHKLNNIKIPQRLHKIAQTPISKKYLHREIYIYRNLIESEPITNELREAISIALKSKDEWVTKRRHAPIVDKSKISEIEENSKIQRRILLERQNPDFKHNSDVIKNKLILDIFSEDKINSILFDIIKHMNEEEKKKIIEDYSFRILPLNDREIDTRKILNDISRLIENKKNLSNEREIVKLVDCYFNNEIGKKYSCHEIDVPLKKNKQIESQYSPNEANEEIGKKDTSPIVYLNNEKEENFNKNVKLPKKKVLPSIHKKKMELLKEKEEKEIANIEQFYKLKTSQFTHDGFIREKNEKVPNYLKTTFPEAEFNEDFIAIEKLTDKRLKTSSLSNRLYFNAPSISEIRKSGQHNFLLNALNKKNTYEELMEKLNLMVTSELCDPLNKMLKIDPVGLDFGYIKTEEKHQMYLKIRNDDNLTNRVYIKSSNNFITVELFNCGKIVPGEYKLIKVVINGLTSNYGKIDEYLQILTKSFIYKVPIIGIAVASEEFNRIQGLSNVKISNAEPYTDDSLSKLDKNHKSNILLPQLFNMEKYNEFINSRKQQVDENESISDI